MYIKAVKSYTKKNGEPQFSYQLVESFRIQNKVRQRVLLNLGSKWSLPKDQWRLLAQRIEDKLSGQTNLIAFDTEIDEQATEISEILIQRGWPELHRQRKSQKWVRVNLSTLEHEPPRSAGGERLCLHALAQLEFISTLQQLGVGAKDAALCAVLVVARMLHPASERETLRWIKKHSAILEILKLNDAMPPSLDKLYRLNDVLWKHQKALQQALFERERELFDLPSAVVFYDLTNVHYHGRANAKLMCFGKSKQKRNDCPLVSLALALDGQGFPRHCEILPGNVVESGTLKNMLKRLQKIGSSSGGRKPTVVMDAGIATEDNLEWLSKNHYHWVVVSRQAKPAAPQETASLELQTTENSRVRVWRLPKESDDDETESGQHVCKEAKLYIHSEHKQAGDAAILSRQRQLFEEALEKLHQGLRKPHHTKNYDKVLERIGRIKQKYTKVARHYDIKVSKAATGKNADSVKWRYSAKRQQADDHAGSYVLRTSHGDWSDEKIVRTYWQISDIEATFRSLKSELGLRPIWHRLEHRVKTHLFISVLAYHAVQLLRLQFKEHNIHRSWKSVRDILANWMRVTTTLKAEDGRTIINRQDVRPSAEQAQLAFAAGMKIKLHRVRR